jgi:hypothetical protein
MPPVFSSSMIVCPVQSALSLILDVLQGLGLA